MSSPETNRACAIALLTGNGVLLSKAIEDEQAHRFSDQFYRLISVGVLLVLVIGLVSAFVALTRADKDTNVRTIAQVVSLIAFGAPLILLVLSFLPAPSQ